jgi:hypothetical protein
MGSTGQGGRPLRIPDHGTFEQLRNLLELYDHQYTKPERLRQGSLGTVWSAKGFGNMLHDVCPSLGCQQTRLSVTSPSTSYSLASRAR